MSPTQYTSLVRGRYDFPATQRGYDSPADCLYYGNLEKHNHCQHSILLNTTVKVGQKNGLRSPGITPGWPRKVPLAHAKHIARVDVNRPLHDVDADVERVLSTYPKGNDCRNNIILNTVVHGNFLQYPRGFGAYNWALTNWLCSRPYW